MASLPALKSTKSRARSENGILKGSKRRNARKGPGVNAVTSESDGHGVRIGTPRVLELGAGTAIASMVCARRGAQVTVQELPSVMPHTLRCLSMNGVCPQAAVADEWGPRCVRASLFPDVNGCEDTEKPQKEQVNSDISGNAFDYVIMADVFYHEDHFQSLAETITSCVSQYGTVVIVYEQRRRDLTSFFGTLKESFHVHETWELLVSRNRETGTTAKSESNEEETIEVTFHIHAFRARKLN
jgi:predicted nicotinamide N-methyase